MDFQHWFGGQEASQALWTLQIGHPVRLGLLLLVVCGSFTFSTWSALAESLGTLSRMHILWRVCFPRTLLSDLLPCGHGGPYFRLSASALPSVDSFLLGQPISQASPCPLPGVQWHENGQVSFGIPDHRGTVYKSDRLHPPPDCTSTLSLKPFVSYVPFAF